MTTTNSHPGVDPETGRRTWRALEAVHAMIYFTPDALVEYSAVGVTKHRTGYFASRSAPMGEVGADVVIATFYNFAPGLVRHAMRDAWTLTSAPVILAARQRAADTSLRRAFGDEILGSNLLADAATTARRAALVAGERVEGRPLFAGHAGLDWPDEPHLALWHAQSLLREFRGDGHIAALTVEGLSGLDALISHAGSGDVAAEVLRATRAWSVEEWTAAVADMSARGLVLPDGSLTEAGRAQRARIEAATDRLAVAPYAAIGAEGCALLTEAGRVLTGAIHAAGLMPVPS